MRQRSTEAAARADVLPSEQRSPGSLSARLRNGRTASTTTAARNRTATVASIVTLSAAALAVSLFRVGSQSLWLDEGFSVHFARSSLVTLPSLIRAESNMALYHLLLHFWLFLGQSEAVIRGLSVLFAVATIPVLFVLAERLFDRRVAWSACALLIPNVFYVHYAQEARSYALVLFLSVAASALFVRALERPSKRHWTAYALAVGLGTWAHFFVILVAGAHLISLTFLERRLRPSTQTLLSVCAGVVIAVAPLALFVSSQNGHKADWLTAPSPTDAVRAIEALAGGRAFLLLAYLLGCAAFTFSAVRLLRRTRGTWEGWRFAFVLSWLVVPIVVAFIVSQVRPIFLDRYLIVVLPALVLAAAAGAMSPRVRAAGAALIVMTVALTARELANYYEHSTKTDWRAAAAFILDHSRPRDAVVFAPPGLHIPMTLPVAYYLARAPRNEVRPVALYPRVDWRPGLAPRVAAGELDLPNATKLRAAEERYRRIWLVVPKSNLQSMPAPLRKSRETALKSVAGLVPVMTKEFGNLRVDVLRQRPSH